jgi:hypothetical protein
MHAFNQPGPDNAYLAKHAELLIASYQHWTGKHLLQQQDGQDLYRALYNAPYAIVSHNTDADQEFTNALLSS